MTNRKVNLLFSRAQTRLLSAVVELRSWKFIRVTNEVHKLRYKTRDWIFYGNTWSLLRILIVKRCRHLTGACRKFNFPHPESNWHVWGEKRDQGIECQILNIQSEQKEGLVGGWQCLLSPPPLAKVAFVVYCLMFECSPSLTWRLFIYRANHSALQNSQHV